MYGLVHAGFLWSKQFSAELAARECEQCQADPCIFRRVLRLKVVVIIVVYVDDVLVVSETKRSKEQKKKIKIILFPNQGLRGARILSRMPHHAGS